MGAKNAASWRQPRLLVGAIATVAVLLAFTSYQFFNDAANRIIEVAAAEDRTSARILAHDLANSLSNKLEGVQQNVQIIAQSPSVQDRDIENVKALLRATQQTSDDLTDFYGWLDGDGRIVWASSAGENSDAARFVGVDRSDRDWFTGARDAKEGYAISAIDSLDGIDRLFISYPIIGSQSGGFEGVIYAGVPLAKVNDFLASQLYPEKEIATDLVDMKGTILQAKHPDLLGMNFFSEEYQAAIGGYSTRFQELVRQALADPSSGPGAADFIYGGQAASAAYSYVKVGGTDFAVVFARVPHVIAADVEALIDQQRFASVARMAVVGSAAVFISVLVISWNRKLERTVADRTQALAYKTDELSAANEQLKQNDRLQKEFINIAAHELRTPITPILTSIEAVERVKDSEGKEVIVLAEEYYHMILRNVKRLERLSSDILQAARIESGTFRLGKEKFDLGRLVSNVIADASKSRPDSKKAIQIVFEPGHDGDLVIEADQMKLYQVVTNLVQNAIRFTTEGKIAVITERSDGSVVVRVRDTGSGISQDVLPRLFQKFASASSSQALGGTGLGLYISKSIIEAHGGRIWAENNAGGKGATFSFSIPTPNL
jgi:signal transduction histidine kinase